MGANSADPFSQPRPTPSHSFRYIRSSKAPFHLRVTRFCSAIPALSQLPSHRSSAILAFPSNLLAFVDVSPLDSLFVSPLCVPSPCHRTPGPLFLIAMDLRDPLFSPLLFLTLCANIHLLSFHDRHAGSRTRRSVTFQLFAN